MGSPEIDGGGIGKPEIAAVTCCDVVAEIEAFDAPKASTPETMNIAVTKDVERKSFDIGSFLLGILAHCAWIVGGIVALSKSHVLRMTLDPND